MATWHEDDEFWEALCPILLSEKAWNDSVAEIDGMIELLEIEPGACVLDLGCGPGRHSLGLTRRGFKMTGVDRTRRYLDEACRRAEEEGLDIEFVQEDMRRFVRPEAFDAAINFFTAFGYFEDPENDRQVAENLCRSLKPGGKLIMDLMGKEVLARIFQERHWEILENGAFLLQESKLYNGWSWIESRWIFLDGEKRREFTVSHRLYSGAELSSLLRSCGFESVTLFGDLNGSPYDQKAKRLVALAVR